MKYAWFSLFFILPGIGELNAQPCDDDASAFLTVSGPVCGGAPVFLTFTAIDDDDTDLIDITYSFGGQLHVLENVFSPQTVVYYPTVSTTATLISVYFEDDDDDGCLLAVNQSVPVIVYPLPGLLLTPDPADCGQNNGSIQAQGTGGQPPYLYRLNNGAYQGSGTFTNLPGGIYTVYVRDANNCTGQQTISLSSNQGPGLQVNIQNQPDCGQNNGALLASGSGGTPPYQYRLNGGSFQSGGSFTGLGPGVYSVEVRDANNCLDGQQITLNNPGNLGLILELAAGPFCGQSDGRILVSPVGGTPPIAYSLNGGAPQSNPAFNGLPDGFYEITATDAQGCASILEIMLEDPTDNLSPAVAVNDTLFVAAGQTQASANLLTNDEAGANPGLYLVQVPAQAQAGLIPNGLLSLEAPGGLQTEVFSYAICQADCELLCDTALIFLFVGQDSTDTPDDPCSLENLPDAVFPEGITPNGDGYNDRLVFEIIDPSSCPYNYAQSELVIYSRWGDRVLEAIPYNNDWDSGSLPPGVYYYVLKINLEEEFVHFGTVSVFK